VYCANAILQVCGAAILLAWIIFLGLWYRKRRRRNKEEHRRKIENAIIAAAHPTSHPNTPGNEMPSPRLGDRLPVDPLASKHAEGPETNSAAYYTSGADANLVEKEKSTL
jgi:hypothetical protein